MVNNQLLDVSNILSMVCRLMINILLQCGYDILLKIIHVVFRYISSYLMSGIIIILIGDPVIVYWVGDVRYYDDSLCSRGARGKRLAVDGLRSDRLLLRF